MLRWLRARNRYVYYVVLYGRALRRPKIAGNLLRAVAVNTVRAVFKPFATPPSESGSGHQNNAAVESEGVGQVVKQNAGKKRKKKPLNEVAKRKELAKAEAVESSERIPVVNGDGKFTAAEGRHVAEATPVRTKEIRAPLNRNGKTSNIARTGSSSATVDWDRLDSVPTLDSVKESNLAPDLSGTTKTTIGPTAAAHTSHPTVDASEEFDALTTPVLPGHKIEKDGRALSEKRKLTKKKSEDPMTGALKSLYRRVPFQLQSKLTEAFGIRFKNETQIRRSQLQQRNSIIPTHKMSFVPYITDMTVDEKEALVDLFGQAKCPAEVLEEAQGQISSLRATKASLELDILPGVKIEDQTEPSIGFAVTALQNFVGKVVVDDNQTATIFAQEEGWLRPDASDRLVYYIDVASSPTSQSCRVGIAIPQRLSSGAATHEKWELHPVDIRDELPATEAETAALAFLLSWIRAKVDDEAAKGILSQNLTVAIFTHNRDGLAQLAKKSPLGSRDRCQYLLLSKIHELVNHLAHNGVRTELHWVPRGAPVPGNQVAHVLANRLSGEEYTIGLLNATGRLRIDQTQQMAGEWPVELVRAQEQGKSLLEQMKGMRAAQKTELIERLRKALSSSPRRRRNTALNHISRHTIPSIALDRDIYEAPVTQDPLKSEGESANINPVEVDMDGHVFMLPNPEAMAFAFEDEHLRGTDPSRVVYWTDASVGGNHAAMASVTRKRNINRQLAPTFRVYAWKNDHMKSQPAEITAMILTLKEVWEERLAIIPGRKPDQTKTIVIYTDSKSTLRQITNVQPLPLDTTDEYWLLEQLTEWIHRYKCVGIQVQLHWVPGHMGIPGNELANEVANTALRRNDRASSVPRGSKATPSLVDDLPDSRCESTPNELVQLAPAPVEMERILSKVYENLSSKQQRCMADLFGFAFDPGWGHYGSQNKPYKSLLDHMQLMSERDKVILARGLLQHVETSWDVLEQVKNQWAAKHRQLLNGLHALRILEATKRQQRKKQKASVENFKIQCDIFVRPWAEAIAFALEYDVLTTESRSQSSCYIDMRFNGKESPPGPCFATAENPLTRGKREFWRTNLLIFRKEIDPLEAQFIGIISVLAEMLIQAQKNKSADKQSVVIFSDFRPALKLLQRGFLSSTSPLYPLAQEVARLVGELQSNGVVVQMDWVPGDINTRGSTVTKSLLEEVFELGLDASEQASSPKKLPATGKPLPSDPKAKQQPSNNQATTGTKPDKAAGADVCAKGEESGGKKSARRARSRKKKRAKSESAGGEPKSPQPRGDDAQ